MSARSVAIAMLARAIEKFWVSGRGMFLASQLATALVDDGWHHSDDCPHVEAAAACFRGDHAGLLAELEARRRADLEEAYDETKRGLSRDQAASPYWEGYLDGLDLAIRIATKGVPDGSEQ